MEAADPYLFERPAWHARAACRGQDPDLFFPERGDDTSIGAVLYCSRCPVTEECLDHALRSERDGVWAGTSGKQRRTLRKTRRIRLVVADPEPFDTPDPDTSSDTPDMPDAQHQGDAA